MQLIVDFACLLDAVLGYKSGEQVAWSALDRACLAVGEDGWPGNRGWRSRCPLGQEIGGVVVLAGLGFEEVDISDSSCIGSSPGSSRCVRLLSDGGS